MSLIWVRRVAAVVSLAVACGAMQAQTDVSGSLYGAFNGSTNGDGVQQSPANAAGAMLALRHSFNPLVGFEVSYSFNRDNTTYSESTVTCGLPCGTVPGTYTQYVPSNAHQVAADYVVSVPIFNFRVFALGGAGVILNQASGTGTRDQYNVLYNYGAGLDYTVLPHLGIRGQYRGNVYHSPQLATAFSSTKAFTKTAEPMVGVYLRF
jgi:opacity protein-like surface antigen